MSIYDQVAGIYDQRYDTPEAHAEDDTIFTLLAPYLKGSVLDVGCGTGLLLDNADPYAYIGMDPSEGMRAEFSKKHPHRIALNATWQEFTPAVPHWDTLVSLYGSCSYIPADEYPRLRDTATHYFLMFYKDGYLPDFYTENNTVTNYPEIERVFDHVYEWHSFLIATNTPGRAQ